MFFFNFWTKGHKIVEILALLTTERSSSKEYNVAGYAILLSTGFNI